MLRWSLVLWLLIPEMGLASGLWIDGQRLAHLPLAGPAWHRLKQVADQPLGRPDLSDQESDADVRALAKALVFARLHQDRYRRQVIQGCRQVMGSEAQAGVLALGRNLVGWILAADLVTLPADLDQTFRGWLHQLPARELDHQSLRSVQERRPNNWGTHAGASLAAIAAYLGDRKALDRIARIFHGWLGDRSQYQGFRFGSLAWQADPLRPVGINPAGSRCRGYVIDGVLPDDQRRSGPFRWPPPRENYVWEALQGAVVQAVLLSRQGYAVWKWQNRALLRAVRWLYTVARYPAQGDDTWIVPLINFYYQTRFPVRLPTRPGKNMGWTGWTHGPCPPASSHAVAAASRGADSHPVPGMYREATFATQVNHLAPGADKQVAARFAGQPACHSVGW